MRLTAHAFSFPRDEDHPGDWEDAAAYRMTEGRSWIAVADGAGSGYMVKEWARRIVTSFLEKDMSERGEQFVLGQCVRWEQEIEQSLRHTDDDWLYAGALSERETAAAFVGVVAAEVEGGWDYAAIAVGDCCMMLIRDETLQLSFPVSNPRAFRQDPDLLYARRAKLPSKAQWVPTHYGRLKPGDMLLLASDKLSQCLLSQAALTEEWIWRALGSIDQPAFQDLIRELRTQGCLDEDDVTLLRVCVPN